MKTATHFKSRPLRNPVNFQSKTINLAVDQLLDDVEVALVGGEHLDMLAELGLADLELRNACAPRRMSVWTLGDARWWQDCVVRPLTSGRSALASTWRNDVYALAH